MKKNWKKSYYTHAIYVNIYRYIFRWCSVIGIVGEHRRSKIIHTWIRSKFGFEASFSAFQRSLKDVSPPFVDIIQKLIKNDNKKLKSENNFLLKAPVKTFDDSIQPSYKGTINEYPEMSSNVITSYNESQSHHITKNDRRSR